jgi:bla regulator protein BlaR1
MIKHNNIFLFSVLIFTLLLFSSTVIAQEKKSFLQTRFNGFTETITKDFTKEKLSDFKKNLAKQGLFFSFSNLKYNTQNEIIKITITVKNKRSNSEVTFYDRGKPISNIEVGEVNGIVIAAPNSTIDFTPTDLKSNKFTTNYKRINKNPIYIVDGKIISTDSFKKIKTNTIESISVLKGKNAIKKYGNKGKYGVIEIKIKKN